MDVQGNPSQGLAQVLSLSLHRLQRAPRAVHRAFLARPSLYRLHRNIMGVFHADALSFLKDRAQTELCIVQLISQAQSSVFVLSDGRDAILRSAVQALKDEKPHIRVRDCAAQNFVLIVDDRIALIAKGGFGLVVEGPIAAEIARLKASRFNEVSDRSPKRVPTVRANWPFRTRLDLENLGIGLSRTGITEKQFPILEIERLTLDAIRSAKRFVYLEINHLTSSVLAKAISQKLKSKEGPEFVVVLPPGPSRYLENAVIAEILKVDHHERFHVFERPFAEATCSLMIVDDQFLKIGTSQFTLKSFGGSDEIDLSIEALGRPLVVMVIARLRRERLGALLGLDPAEFDARFLLNGSLNGTLLSFFTPTRMLPEKTPAASRMTQLALRLSPLVDPKKWLTLKRRCLRMIRFARKRREKEALIFALLIMFVSLFARRALG